MPKIVPFSECPPYEFLFGFVDAHKNHQKSYALKRLKGRVLRDIAHVMRTAPTDQPPIEAVFKVLELSLETMGGYKGIGAYLGNLVAVDRDMALVQGKIDDNPVEEIDLVCQHPVETASGVRVCGHPQKYPYDYRTMHVRVPEEQDVVWFENKACFLYSDPARGIDRAVVRYPTVNILREAFKKEHVEESNTEYVLLSRCLLALNDQEVLTADQAAERKRHYLYDLDELIDTLEKPQIVSLNTAFAERQFGPDNDVAFECEKCGNPIPHSLNLISHFFELVDRRAIGGGTLTP